MTAWLAGRTRAGEVVSVGRAMVFAAFLVVCLAAECARAELTPELGLEEMARRAPVIVRGVVDAELRVRVVEPLKGVVLNETIDVAGLEGYNDLIKAQWKTSDHRLQELQGLLTNEACDRLAADGLVGATVVLFLEPVEEAESYALCGRTARFPKSNYEDDAIRLIVENDVLRLRKAGGQGRLGLQPDRAAPTPERLTAAIGYDRPLLLQFGYTTAIGGGKAENYFHFSLMNLTDKAIEVNLADTLTLTLAGPGLDEDTVLPPEPWTEDSLVETLEPGRRIVGQYRLNKLPADGPVLAKGEAYEGRLTIALGEGENEDVYTVTAVGTIR